MTEVWKPVVGYEGLYEVSDLGRVRSLARIVETRAGYQRHVRERIRRFGLVSTGYFSVSLHRDCVGRTKRVAHLVAAAFIGPRPHGCEVCHCDGDPLNDRRTNLRYDTPKGNSADRFRHGTVLQGEAHPRVKLTAEQVAAIRQDTRKQGLIAADYSVTQSNISHIKRGKSWTAPRRGAAA